MVLEIELQGARQVRAAMPEALQIFIAPPSAETLRERLIGRGTDAADDIERRLAVAEEELAARGEFAPRRRQRRPRPGRGRAVDAIVAATTSRPAKLAKRSLTPRITREAQTAPRFKFRRSHSGRTTRRQVAREDRLALRAVIVAAKRARQISSYYHGLGEGHFGEYAPPMVDTRSKNYLTIALEEVEADKIKYQYR